MLASWLMPGCRKSQGTRPTKSSHCVPRRARRAAGAAPVLFLSASSCAPAASRPQQAVRARLRRPDVCSSAARAPCDQQMLLTCYGRVMQGFATRSTQLSIDECSARVPLAIADRQRRAGIMARAHPDGRVVPQLAAAVTIQEVDVAGWQRRRSHDPGVADLAGRQAHQRRVPVLPPRRRQQPDDTLTKLAGCGPLNANHHRWAAGRC